YSLHYTLSSPRALPFFARFRPSCLSLSRGRIERMTASQTFSQTHTQNTAQVRQVLWRVLVLNVVVAAAKLAVGILTGAVSMIADGFHSSVDASSNVIGLVGTRLASQPPDDDHPYGHRRFETLATLAIGGML